MNKVVLKSVLITLASLAVAAVLVFVLWLFCAPQSMATACEKTGNYSFAVTCANLRYKKTGDIYDLARCAENGILSGKDKHIKEYCYKLVSEEEFSALCIDKDEKLSNGGYGAHTVNYRAYICGHLAAAQYRGGDLISALQSAQTGGTQSYTRLVSEIIQKNDKPSAESVIAELEKAEQNQDVKNLIALLKKM